MHRRIGLQLEHRQRRLSASSSCTPEAAPKARSASASAGGASGSYPDLVMQHLGDKLPSELKNELTTAKDAGDWSKMGPVMRQIGEWAKANGCPVGPGRGSGAGSLVAYSIGVTDLDPLPYNLLFERFLNPERVSMPDFDIDFCMDNRDRVIEYVGRKYGRERVGQIITYATMAARGVVRDVTRVLGHGYGFGDRLAKLIPGTPGATLADAVDHVSEVEVGDHVLRPAKGQQQVRAFGEGGIFF